MSILTIPIQIKEIILRLPTLKLPLNGFTMYKISIVKGFWFGVIYQVVAADSNFMVSLTYGAFVAGFMLQLCAQIDILKYNIKSVPDLDDNLQHQTIKKCVNHHNDIMK